MELTFTKYQGTGNDFILIDNRQNIFPKDDTTVVPKLADRKFGIGADGLMLIEEHPKLDFRMIYYNADGSKSLCGNGSRCAVSFAKELGIIGDHTIFETTDGVHKAFFREGVVHFELRDVTQIQSNSQQQFFVNTGSPHHIEIVQNSDETDVFTRGKAIRESKEYAPDGTNVNFVEISGKVLKVRTFERGVEDETLSCGTGVTAAALASTKLGLKSPIQIETLGGCLSVSFTATPENHFTNIYLAGPATKVFEGKIHI